MKLRDFIPRTLGLGVDWGGISLLAALGVGIYLAATGNLP